MKISTSLIIMTMMLSLQSVAASSVVDEKGHGRLRSSFKYI
jgi:hypothetical protein